MTGASVRLVLLGTMVLLSVGSATGGFGWVCVRDSRI